MRQSASAVASMTRVSLADVKDAARRLSGQIERTPMRRSRTFSALTGATVWFKFENLQYTASFKERGAFVRLAQLTEAERAKGVIAMSAGNHAQGVAYHAQRLGIPAVIVMPLNTPFIKIDNTERLGARVVLFGETVDDAAQHAHALARQDDLAFIHPFDDPHVIAGQGSIGLEMLEDCPELETLIVPIGGGGLISGIAIAAKAINPSIEIVGVEAALYPSTIQTLAGEPVKAGGRTLADGIAVKQPGKLTLEIIRELVDRIVLVDEPDLERAVVQLLEIEKTVVEGAGAAGLAALLSDPSRFAGRTIGLILCGGNIDSRLLSDVILRGLVSSHRLVRTAVALPDSPGALNGLTTTLADTGANIVDVVHRRAFSGRSVREAVVDLTLETRNRRHAEQMAAALRATGFRLLDDR